MAVVDTHARVYGVTGVRVVDASAFPFLPPGHPQSTVCKISPKCTVNNGCANYYCRCTRREDRSLY